MKKLMNKTDDQLREKPVVYIYVTFGDDVRTFKELRLVVNHSVLLEFCDLIDKLSKDDKQSSDKFYNEAINLTFRPKVSINDICTSVIKYICCSDRVKNLLVKYPNDNLYFTRHINVDNDDWSEEYSPDPAFIKEYMQIEDEFKLIGKLDVSLTLPSKLQFLYEVEEKFLFRLYKLILETNDRIIKMTYGQFWDLVDEEDAEDGEDFTKNEMDEIISNLLLYDFITLNQEYIMENGEETHYFVLSINDLQNFYDFIKLYAA